MGHRQVIILGLYNEKLQLHPTQEFSLNDEVEVFFII